MRILVVLLALLSFAYRANCQEFTSEKIKVNSFSEITDSTVVDFFNYMDSLSKDLHPRFTHKENYLELVMFSKSPIIANNWTLKVHRYHEESNEIQAIAVGQDRFKNRKYTEPMSFSFLIPKLLALKSEEEGNFYKQYYFGSEKVVKYSHRRAIFIRKNGVVLFGVFCVNFDDIISDDASENHPSSLVDKFN